ncbi:MAG: arsenosugar biosynthesis radical SAM protein ArsS [Myxococcota bacterium]|nr:arsenosugar biosynthesis radical SAM protein ArsS [Myxococcota bacterium]
MTRDRVEVLQVNIGKRCNLACHHCHVESSPKRREKLSPEGCARILELLAQNPEVQTLDLTGGAPELHEGFRDLVAGARALGRRVIDRCNLTVLFEEGQEDTAEFLADQGVEIVASLPCYTPENLEAQRGRGVFAGSIEALRRLNALGYGAGDRERVLDLVYNPGGAHLPPPQEELEAEYRVRLAEDFGIRFDRLLTLTNMPIKRFAHDLARRGQVEAYMALLVAHFNPATLPGLMCRSMLSVDHRGQFFDCDFNQALDLPVHGPKRNIWETDRLADLAQQPIRTAPHCFGCTAGTGSSCSGALV